MDDAGLIRHSDSSSKHFEEVVQSWEVYREIKLSKYILLHGQHLVLRTGVVSHVDVVLNSRGIDLLVLGCDDHCCNAKQLHLVPSNLPTCEESVNQVGRNVQRFSLKSELYLDVNQPVDQDHSHLLIDLALLEHVSDPWVEGRLLSTTPEVDVVCVLKPIEREYCRLRLVLPQSCGVHISNLQLS